MVLLLFYALRGDFPLVSEIFFLFFDLAGGLDIAWAWLIGRMLLIGEIVPMSQNVLPVPEEDGRIHLIKTVIKPKKLIEVK